jgi:hypothetical protein
MLDWAIQHGNLIEAGLWLTIGAGFALSALAPARRGSKMLAALAFALFGLTDVVEHRTGAWWRPWWLLVLKAGCIVALLVLLIHYRRQIQDDD